MIKKLWSGIKKVTPWIIVLAFITALVKGDYPEAIVCLLLMILTELSDIRAALKEQS